jgi:hypothetical protein
MYQASNYLSICVALCLLGCGDVDESVIDLDNPLCGSQVCTVYVQWNEWGETVGRAHLCLHDEPGNYRLKIVLKGIWGCNTGGTSTDCTPNQTIPGVADIYLTDDRQLCADPYGCLDLCTTSAELLSGDAVDFVHPLTPADCPLMQ